MRSSLQFFQIVAIDDGVGLGHDKCAGVVAVDDAAQVVDLILGNQHIKHGHRFFGVFALCVQLGDAAVQLVENILFHVVRVDFGNDVDLHIDILRVEPVNRDGQNHCIDDGVQRSRKLEQQRTRRIQNHIGGQVDLTHRNAGALLHQNDANHIHAATGAAHIQDDTAANAGGQTAQQAFGQRVAARHDVDDRDERHTKCHRSDGADRFKHKTPVDFPPCDQQNGEIDNIIQNRLSKRNG